jgi:putative ATPase
MIPLAERMRPGSLDFFIGQEHLVGNGSVLRRSIDAGGIPSMILWGPPGSGKTTLAQIIAKRLSRPFSTLSATGSGVKQVREIIKKFSENNINNTAGGILFIDEIHRFSKSQQDSLLGAVEKGIITLIGATTENPSFEVISALLSRCQIYILKSLGKEQLLSLLDFALSRDIDLKNKNITIREKRALLRFSGGDARKLYNALELAVQAENEENIIITDKLVESVLQQNLALYDKSGEQHYDIISAFIKSLRGSDPNAAVYWLARMVEGGEDPKFIARRMLIFASEDIGNANPTAFVLANNCFQAVNVIGWPESRIILSQCAIYLSCSPKSNASYMAIEKAQETVKKTGDLPVPLHIRNAPTKLMKELNYGKNYQYPHQFERNFAGQEYLPDPIQGEKFYNPGRNAKEEQFKNFLKNLWNEKYDY